ncbi:hypothetical protein LWI28_007481 [Acer negundo]|uniref:Uncharacterized protein n=1 Tax=Acer negundo TaxID=4023 RepID=A0AAD5JJ52_ACENE|nr:hypothetical protein LWI28_007481 [Acer negundo]
MYTEVVVEADVVTEGVQDEEESRDNSVKTNGGDNVMSLYSGDEKVSEDTGDQESASEETGDEEQLCDTQVNQLKQSKSKKRKTLESGAIVLLIFSPKETIVMTTVKATSVHIGLLTMDTSVKAVVKAIVV